MSWLQVQLMDFGVPKDYQTNLTNITFEEVHESTPFIALTGYTDVQKIILYLIASSVIFREVLHTWVCVGSAF